MIATIPYIEQKFDEFNTLCFGGRLRRPPIVLNHTRRTIAMCHYRVVRRADGTRLKTNFSLRFSVEYNLTPEELDDTILHEMIHYYIDSNQLRDTSAHGILFRKIMDTLNTRFGRHITVSAKADNKAVQKLVDTRRLWRVVAVATMADGKQMIKVLPRILERLQYFKKNVGCSPSVKRLDFYLTDNPFFSRYPKSAALRLYAITPEELSTHLHGAKQLTEIS